METPFFICCWKAPTHPGHILAHICDKRFAGKGWMTVYTAGFEYWLLDGTMNTLLSTLLPPPPPTRAHMELIPDQITMWMNTNSHKNAVSQKQTDFLDPWPLTSPLPNKQSVSIFVNERWYNIYNNRRPDDKKVFSLMKKISDLAEYFSSFNTSWFLAVSRRFITCSCSFLFDYTFLRMFGRRKDTQTQLKPLTSHTFPLIFSCPPFLFGPTLAPSSLPSSFLPSFPPTSPLPPRIFFRRPSFCLFCFAEPSPAIIPGLPGETRLPSLNWRGVKKLICCLILKLPSPVSGPDPVRAVVNFNHGLKLEWDNCARVVYTWRTICDRSDCQDFQCWLYYESVCVCARACEFRDSQ